MSKIDKLLKGLEGVGGNLSRNARRQGWNSDSEGASNAADTAIAMHAFTMALNGWADNPTDGNAEFLIHSHEVWMRRRIHEDTAALEKTHSRLVAHVNIHTDIGAEE